MSFLDSLASGLGSVFKPIGSILGGLAPMAGQLIGTSVGGPMGGMLGGGLGSMFGGLLGGGSGGGQQPHPQQPQQQRPNSFSVPVSQPANNSFMSGLNSAQNQYGQMANNAFNQYMPQQMQGMQFGNMGHGLGQMAGNYMDQYIPKPQGYQGPTFGQAMGGMMGHYGQEAINKYLPNSMSNVPLGNIGGYGAQMAANQIRPYAQQADTAYQNRPSMLGGMLQSVGNRLGFGGGGQSYPPQMALSHMSNSFSQPERYEDLAATRDYGNASRMGNSHLMRQGYEEPEQYIDDEDLASTRDYGMAGGY